MENTYIHFIINEYITVFTLFFRKNFNASFITVSTVAHNKSRVYIAHLYSKSSIYNYFLKKKSISHSITSQWDILNKVKTNKIIYSI